MAKKKAKKRAAASETKRKLTKAQRAELLKSRVRITGGRIIRISATNQRMALCGAACTCVGAGCGLTHPSGLHCQSNPVCPSGCSGTCNQGLGHEPYSAAHSCPHGHSF
jgi:hypothetical protein